MKPKFDPTKGQTIGVTLRPIDYDDPYLLSDQAKPVKQSLKKKETPFIKNNIGFPECPNDIYGF